MLNNIFKEKVKSILLTLVGLVLVVIVTVWFSSNRVSANVWPISVSVSHIDFGTAFPGETLQENFTVNYLDKVDGITYRIVQKPKPRTVEDPHEVIFPSNFPGGIEAWDYCLNHDDDPEYLTYCYRNLCPFLIKDSIEQEGDTENLASVGATDTSDVWTIYFQVPAIFGHVSQDHIGEVVSSNGEYGCDVSIEIIEQ